MSLTLGSMTAFTANADDLAQVYQQALANDPVVLKAKAQRDAAYKAVPLSRANLLPQISGYVGYTMSTRESTDFAQDPVTGGLAINIIDSDSDTLAYGIDLNMSLYDHANYVGLDRAEKIAQQSDAQYAAAMQNLITRVVDAYFAVLRARDNVTFVRKEKEAIGKQLEQTKQRFEVGLTAMTDVHEAQANFDATVAQEIQALNQLEMTLEGLRVITGKYHDKLYNLDTNSFSATQPSPAQVDNWLSIAEEKNLSLLVNRLALDIAKEDIAAADAGHYPTVGLSASMARTDSDISSGGNDINLPALDSYSVGVNVSVPIFSGFRTQNLAEQARDYYVSASQDLEQSYRQTIQSVRSSYNDVKAAISTIKAFEQSVVSAQSALNATQAGFEVGTRTIVDVLNSTRNLFDAQRNLSGARYDFIQAVVKLKQAAGNLTSEDLEQINKGLEPVQG